MKERCSWVNLKNPIYVAYHDQEWGVPVWEDQKLFEMLLLEGAQAGLSWETVLNKREGYCKAFSGFEAKKIARFSPAKLLQLEKNPAIIRNRLKIKSAVQNAKAFLALQKEEGGFAKYLWNWVEGKPIQNHFKKLSQIPAKTELSDQISRDLKKRGFNFVGSSIIYAWMQAVGLVNDHLVDCFCYPSVQKLKPKKI
ncbi:MAG: DNA-3-methyladenine glycosylase I [Deltaproteobacteria bacterium]|nr:DNA-3-methyladenine glycosylase I [Deltaproteobacteria bacterium]